MYVERNTEARLRHHCCNGSLISKHFCFVRVSVCVLARSCEGAWFYKGWSEAKHR
jgi:hypothetical protein